MDLSFRFDGWYRRLPASPRDEGRVEGLVIRPAGGAPGTRRRCASIVLDPKEGIVGDRWAEGPERMSGAQVSLINVHALRSLAGGDEEKMALSGDNLHVDLDLSEANLPIGTRLEIGSTVLEVSEVPHRPCRSFHERFGATAAKKVARGVRIGLRGRGVLCRILTAGTIHVGDRIVVRRPAQPASRSSP